MTVLRRRGLHADAARNGIEAPDQLAVHHYEVMLLDLMMPQMNGYEVLTHLAAQPADRRPLVLVLTAGLEPRPLDTRIVIGMLHKPFDVELLVDTVVGCMRLQTSTATETSTTLSPLMQTSVEEPN